MKKKILICLAVAVFLALSALCIFKLPELQKYTKGDKNIKGNIENIKIECAGGNITVEPTQRVFFSLEEKGTPKDSEKSIEWLVSGKTLKIKCTAEDKREYIITVPAETVLDDLDIKGKNINAQVTGLTIRDLTLRTDSGGMNVTDCKCIDALVAETDDAPVQIENTFARRLDIETEGGNVIIGEPSFQRDCKVITGEGDISVTVQKDSKLNITERHGSGSFTSAFETAADGDKFILKTESGKISIAESKAPEAVNVATTSPAVQTEVPTKAEKTEGTTKAKESTSKKS